MATNSARGNPIAASNDPGNAPESQDLPPPMPDSQKQDILDRTTGHGNNLGSAGEHDSGQTSGPHPPGAGIKSPEGVDKRR